MTGWIQRPVSMSRASPFLVRCGSKFHQWRKSPDPHNRHLLTRIGMRLTDLIDVYGTRLAPQG